tara:strand:+ start:715 stop:1119 length:405 start_codon:yes stop_codon:yes gene_type:complete
MTDFTTYLETRTLDFFLNANSLSTTAPTTVYVALHTATPGEAGTASEATETGYARAAVSFGSATTDTAGATTISNDGAVSIGPITGTPTYTHISIKDAASSGNTLCYGALSSNITLTSGDSVQFSVGNISVTLD